MSSSKKLTCKGILRQVFLIVYRLEIQSVVQAVSNLLCELFPLSPLSGFLSTPPSPPSLCEEILFTVFTYKLQCVRGGGVLGIRQINTGRKVHLQVNFFRRRHFALPSVSLIFLRKHYYLQSGSCRGVGRRLCRGGSQSPPFQPRVCGVKTGSCHVPSIEPRLRR